MRRHALVGLATKATRRAASGVLGPALISHRAILVSLLRAIELPRLVQISALRTPDRLVALEPAVVDATTPPPGYDDPIKALPRKPSG